MIATETTAKPEGLSTSRTGVARTRKERTLQAAMARTQKVAESVRDWADRRAPKVQDVIFVFNNGRIDLYVVTQSEEYDYALSEELTEFASPHIVHGIVGEATLIPQMAPGEMRDYFDHRQAMGFTLLANRERAASNANGG